LIALILNGCGAKNQSEFFDVKNIDQNLTKYIKDDTRYEFNSTFLKRKIFEVWETDVSIKEPDLSFAVSLLAKKGYRENLQPYTKKQKEELLQSAKSCTRVDKNGIVARNSDIRALPTKKPYFFDPKLAGEGYPFDYLQESQAYINTPVKVLCETDGGGFVYVTSFIADGWMDGRDVLYLGRDDMQRVKNSELRAIGSENTKMVAENGSFVENGKIGSFVFVQNGKAHSASQVGIVELANTVTEFTPIPSAFTPKALIDGAQPIMDEPYGWGGYLQNRDCSMFLRDLFLPFGLYLPRNSKEQAYFADFQDLSALSIDAKLSKIKAEAEPFRTLLYLKGHIMLYIGVVDGEIVALHDTWGFAYFEAGQEKRHIIGKPIVSTLFVGSAHEWFDGSKSIASRILGMRVLK